MYACVVASVNVQLCVTPWTAALCPWDSSGKNAGVGYGAGYPHAEE